MKKKGKVLALVLSAAALVAVSVFGTMAYLTDNESVTNTFTVGQVGITLDEADVKPDGTLDTANRVQTNEYHLIPGHTYTKDPTVTVEAGSEESYVRMMVTFNYSSQLDTIFPNANLTSIFTGYNSANWELHDVTEDTGYNTRTYEFRYVGTENKGTKDGTVKKVTSDVKLDALFDSFTLPGEITKEQLATLVTTDNEGEITSQFTITVVAHAIQADGFADADAAWKAFGEQITTSTNS